MAMPMTMKALVAIKEQRRTAPATSKQAYGRHTAHGTRHAARGAGTLQTSNLALAGVSVLSLYANEKPSGCFWMAHHST